jgi:toxin ParE1/3/4
VQIEWSQVAFDDVLAIRDYIAADTPFYADQFIDRLMAATEKLADHPQIGRPVPEADDLGIRELIFHSYRIMYLEQTTKNLILIVTVVHGSRNVAGQEPKPWEIV